MDIHTSQPQSRERPGPGAWTGPLVAASWRRAPIVLGVAALLTLLCAILASRLQMDTQTSALLDPTLPWRQQEIAYNAAFPQGKHALLAVVEAASPGPAAKAAGLLAHALAERKDVFTDVSYLGGADFFRRNGVLLQDLDRVKALCEQLVQSAPLLGPFAADPSLRGLFDAFNQGLGAVKAGAIPAAMLDRPAAAIAAAIAAREAGQPAQLSLSSFTGGAAPQPRELMQVIALKPVLDHKTLAPGKKAREAVLATAASLHLTEALGVTLSFSGDVALEDDELGSVKQGMGLATALSSLLVLGILFAAIRAPKPVLAILITLVAGLIATLAFASVTVHALNLISVAFVVMFIGIAVDFGIQFCVRFRDEQTRTTNAEEAIRNAGESIGGALGLAAITTAIGFLAFAPTAYRGVSELGLIAGAGMLIALALNLTLLPALLRYLAPKPLREPPHLFKTPAADRWIRRNRRAILAVTALLALGAAALLPRLAFDFNPLNLKDPNSDSVRTLNKLTAAGLASPNAMQLLVPSRESIGAITARLKALPDIGRVMSIESFLPKDQDEKLQIIRDTGFLLGPAFYAGGHVASPTAEETRESVRDTVERLHLLQTSPGTPPSFGALADVLQKLLDGDPARLAAMEAPLTAPLKERLRSLPLLFQAAPITVESLPDPLKRQWIAPDGRYRIEIRPKGEPHDDVALSRFVAAVHGVAPDALGGAYAIQKSGDVVWASFKQAFLYALIGVVAMLGLVLRRAGDVALIVGPLLLSALLTLAVTVLIGLPINFANVIALPLLMGIGVAFNIYFVTNWRRGQSQPLRSSTARAVVFSALTTLSAVVSLALSPHRGTASMGQLLSLCLAMTLLCALLILPALLALNRRTD